MWYERTGPFTLGSSAYFLLPGPYHPVEVLAAVRGVWPSINADTEEEYRKVMLAGKAREQKTFVTWAAVMAELLAWTPEQVMLVYHLFTPLSTNEKSECRTTTIDLTLKLFLAAGLTLSDAQAAWRGRFTGPYRGDFWDGLVPRAIGPLLETL
jgi:hypothetical protein